MDSTKEDICNIKRHSFPLGVILTGKNSCKEESLSTDADELYSYRTYLIMLEEITNHDSGVLHFHAKNSSLATAPFYHPHKV